jgi:hypothetical protein
MALVLGYRKVSKQKQDQSHGFDWQNTIITYTYNVDDNILAINTAIDIVLACWRASDDKQVLMLAERNVLDQGPVVSDEGCDPVISLKSLPYNLQARSTVSTQDCKYTRQI